MKADVKGKSPTNIPKFTANGSNMQSQFSPKSTLTLYPGEAITLGMSNKRRLKDKISTPFAESPSGLMVRLLDANLIRKISVHQINIQIILTESSVCISF